MDSTQSPHEPEERRARRFPRLLTPPAARRLSPTRLALTAVGILSLIISSSYLGYLAWSRAVRWLHQQPIYSVEFGDIVLDPPPPAWFRGGREGFLRRMSKEANHERFSSLDVDLEKLRLKFQGDPLVRLVKQVELVGPRGLVVRLVYREPVAVPVFGDKTSKSFAIDEEGTLIALSEIEFDSPRVLHGDPTPLIWFKGLDPPWNPQLGKGWLKPADPTSGRSSDADGVEDRRAGEAGEFARFIRLKLLKDKEIRGAVDPFVIHFYLGDSIFLQCGLLKNPPMICWRRNKSLPSETYGDKLTPEEKWGQVRAWLLKNPLKPSEPRLAFTFSEKGLVPWTGKGQP